MIEARCYPSDFEDGGKGQEPKNARSVAREDREGLEIFSSKPAGGSSAPISEFDS